MDKRERIRDLLTSELNLGYVPSGLIDDIMEIANRDEESPSMSTREVVQDELSDVLRRIRALEKQLGL